MSLNRDQVVRLLQVHRECGVPLQHSIALLAKTNRLKLQEIAHRAGCQRTGLYKALTGEFEASVRLRETLAAELGIDPWSIVAGGLDRSQAEN
jgi:hypothetical protein